MSATTLLERLREMQNMPPIKSNPLHANFVDFLDRYRDAITVRVRQLKCQPEVEQHGRGWKNLMQIIKNSIWALNEADNRTEMIDWYFKLCLPTPENFISSVVAGQYDGETETPWSKLGDVLQMHEVEQVYNQVAQAVRRYDPIHQLPPAPVLPTIGERNEANNLLRRLEQLADDIPRCDPATRATETAAFDHLRTFRLRIGEEVREKRWQKRLIQQRESFLNELQLYRNDLYALGRVIESVQLVEIYLRLCMPSPKEFVKAVLEGQPNMSVKAIWDLTKDQQHNMAKQVQSIVEAAEQAHLPPEGTPAGHHPSPASLPPTSHPHSASSSANPVTGHEHHQSAIKPLDLACRAVITNCMRAGVDASTWRLWLARIMNITANAGALPPDEQRQVVRLVGTAATIIGDRATGPGADITAEAALWEYYDLIKWEIRSHTSAALHSLSSSSHPFHRRLSLRQRVIYPRAFTSSFSAY